MRLAFRSAAASPRVGGLPRPAVKRRAAKPQAGRTLRSGYPLKADETWVPAFAGPLHNSGAQLGAWKERNPQPSVRGSFESRTLAWDSKSVSRREAVGVMQRSRFRRDDNEPCYAA